MFMFYSRANLSMSCISDFFLPLTYQARENGGLDRPDRRSDDTDSNWRNVLPFVLLASLKR